LPTDGLKTSWVYNNNLRIVKNKADGNAYTGHDSILTGLVRALIVTFLQSWLASLLKSLFDVCDDRVVLQLSITGCILCKLDRGLHLDHGIVLATSKNISRVEFGEKVQGLLADG
jgi:hypothetical protein